MDVITHPCPIIPSQVNHMSKRGPRGSEIAMLIFQVKSSQRFLLQQNKYHTYINIRDWNPIGFICLLKYIHYSYRAWPHFGDNRVSIGASTEAKRSPKGTGRPPQDALESFHLSTSPRSRDLVGNFEWCPWPQNLYNIIDVWVNLKKSMFFSQHCACWWPDIALGHLQALQWSCLHPVFARYSHHSQTRPNGEL